MSKEALESGNATVKFNGILKINAELSEKYRLAVN